MHGPARILPMLIKSGHSGESGISRKESENAQERVIITQLL